MSGLRLEDVKYSIVVPAYKSGVWLEELVDQIAIVMDRESRCAYELILINDSSPDDVTWPAIVRIAERYPWVRGLNLLYNVGQFNATICGLQHSRGQFVVTMDDDFQHSPEELPKLIHAIEEDDKLLCVFGRYESKRHGVIQNIGSRIYRAMLNRMYGTPKGIDTTAFRIIKRELVDVIVAFRTNKPQISSIIVSVTKCIGNVTVRHEPRVVGKSGYGFGQFFHITLENIISSGTVPLRIFSILGFVFAGASILLSLSFFVRWLVGGIGVAGFTTQVMLITFFGGMTLGGVGLLGEYVSRIIVEITGPARFRVREEVGSQK